MSTVLVSMPRSAFTLLELLAVIMVMMLLMGMGVSGVSTAMRRGASDSSPSVLGGLVDGLGAAAGLSSATGRIYGLTIQRKTDGSLGSVAIPWYVDVDVQNGTIGTSIMTFTSVEALKSIVTTGIEPNATFGYDLPMTGVVGSYFTSSQTRAFCQRKTTSTSTALGAGATVHLCFEPGSGLVRASFTASGTSFAQRFGVSTLTELTGAAADPIELNLHRPSTNAAIFTKDRRLIIYPSGMTEAKGCRD